MNCADRSEEETEILRKRSRLTRDLAESHKRSIHAFKRNWKLRHSNFLLPKADSIFGFLEAEIKNSLYSTKSKYSGANEWSHISEDEGRLETKIQDILAILRWTYWQRLEGYETADVSAIREPSFEDIGGIQQLFAAADALIEDYKSRFSFNLPYDILGVFGLHDIFENPYQHFISAPRYAKYGFFPSWILFSHEIAHIAIRWIEHQEAIWREVEESLKPDEQDWELIKNETFVGMRSALVSSQDYNNEDSELLEEIDRILRGEEEWDFRDYSCSEEKYARIVALWNNFIKKSTFPTPLMIKTSKSLIRIVSLMKKFSENLEEPSRNFIEKNLKEDLSRSLKGDSNYRKVKNFFEIWHEIRRRAMDIAELMMRFTSGSTGRKVLHKPELWKFSHDEMANEVIYDIIATLLSGEYFIYSLCFYYFFPSFIKYENERIRIKPPVRDPFILRSLVCLETLICTRSEISKIFDLLSNIYLYPSNKYQTPGTEIEDYMKKTDLSGMKGQKNRKFIELLQRFDMRRICEVLLSNLDKEMEGGKYSELYNMQRTMMENLLKELLKEEESVMKFFFEAKKQFREGNEEEELRSYFNYMGSALQEDLRLLLREGSPNPKKFEESQIDFGESIPEDNSLRRLILLVKEFFVVKEKGSFYDEFKGFKEIREIKKTAEDLKKGKIVFRSEDKDSERPTKDPRHIISAFCQLYFKEKLFLIEESTEEKPRFEFFKALNSTILSMAWSKEALKRFSSEG